VTVQDKKYHSECFHCAGCNEALSNRVCFHGNPPFPYHPSCAQTLFQNVKSTPVSGTADIPIQAKPPTSGQMSSGSRSSSNFFDSLLPSVGTCAVCLKSISVGTYSECQGNMYHQDCFRCAACHNLLSGKVRFEENLPYHPECAKELFNPHCCICTKAIEGKYARHPFFKKEVYCLDHSDNVKSCYACCRKEPFSSTNKEQFNHLPDGRSLCPKCSETVIMDSSEANILFQQIVEFMEKELHLVIPPEMRSVPILAVDSQAMNENRNRITSGANGHYHDSHPQSEVMSDMPMTRGLTLSTIGTIRHFNHQNLPALLTNRTMMSSAWNNVMESSLFRIEQVRDVTAVLVLYGLPHDLFASVLTHEATHAYIKLTKSLPYDLPSQIEEGICQLVAFKYLDHLKMMKLNEKLPPFVMKNSNSTPVKVMTSASQYHDQQQQQRQQLQRQPQHLGGTTAVKKSASGDRDDEEDEIEFFKYQIESDTSVVYGDGFRMAKKVDDALGLQILLEQVAERKAFPAV
jgi:hypothetical protein